MKKALLIITPAIGHYAGSFRIANALIKLGYETEITVDNEFEPVVSSFGYRTSLLNAHPFGLNYDTILSNTGQKVKDILIGRIEYRLYNDRRTKLIDLFEKFKPSIVLIDSHNSTDFIPLYNLLKNQKIKVIFLQTTLSTRFSWLTPYFNSTVAPHSKVKIIADNLFRRIKYAISSILDKVRFIGYDDRTTILKKFKEEKINGKYKPIWSYPIGCSFNGIPVILASPKELEFNSRNRNEVYLGTSVLDNQSQAINPNKSKLKSEELLYISFGTLTIHKTHVIEYFFDKLDVVLKSYPSLKVITSGGLNPILIERNKARWNRIEVMPFLKQSEILKECDYFITHGGLNSIKEAIVYEIPMLVYPLEGDQFGNAQKVKFHRLGIYGDVYKDSVHAIRNALEYLIKENNGFKTRLAEFSKTIKENYNFEEILLDTINNSKSIT